MYSAIIYLSNNFFGKLEKGEYPIIKAIKFESRGEGDKEYYLAANFEIKRGKWIK